MDPRIESLRRRTQTFAIRIVSFCRRLPQQDDAARALGRQLVRSGTGIGGNYRATCRARSHAEFTAKMGVVVEESDESVYWLGVMDAANIGDTNERQQLLSEARELLAIFSTSHATARRNSRLY